MPKVFILVGLDGIAPSGGIFSIDYNQTHGWFALLSHFFIFGGLHHKSQPLIWERPSHRFVSTHNALPLFLYKMYEPSRVKVHTRVVPTLFLFKAWDEAFT